MEEVLKHFPKELLPIEYGGEDGTIQELIDYWEEKFMEYREYLIEGEGYGADETKRTGNGKADDAEKVFCVEGTFRKLAVD